MTVVIWFHQSYYRTFKAYYIDYVECHLRSEFPTRLRYQRFVELMLAVFVKLVAYLHTQLGRCRGISFIDSTQLSINSNPRIHQPAPGLCRASGPMQDIGGLVLRLQAASGRQ